MRKEKSAAVLSLILNAGLVLTAPAQVVLAASPEEEAVFADASYRLTQIAVHSRDNRKLENALLGEDENWYISEQTLERYFGYKLNEEKMILTDGSDYTIKIDLEKNQLKLKLSDSSPKVTVTALPVYGGKIWFPLHQILPIMGNQAKVKGGELYLQTYSDVMDNYKKNKVKLSRLQEAEIEENRVAWWNIYLSGLLTGEDAHAPEDVHILFKNLTGDNEDELIVTYPGEDNYDYDFRTTEVDVLMLSDSNLGFDVLLEREYTGYSVAHVTYDLALAEDEKEKDDTDADGEDDDPDDKESEIGVVEIWDSVWQDDVSSAAYYYELDDEDGSEKPEITEWDEALGNKQLKKIQSKYGDLTYLLHVSGDGVEYSIDSAAADFGYLVESSGWLFEEGEDLSDYVNDGGRFAPVDYIRDTYAPSQTAFYGVFVDDVDSLDTAAQRIRELRRNGLGAAVYDRQEWENRDTWQNADSNTPYSISVGEWQTEEEAKSVLRYVQKKGYTNAYIQYTGEYGKVFTQKIDDSSEQNNTQSQNLAYEGTASAPFYGIWAYASHDRNVCVAVCDQFTAEGVGSPEIYETTDWSNLNNEHWYAVCLDRDADLGYINKICANIKNAGHDVYVKYSGNFIGN